MDTITVKEITDKKLWEDYVLSLPETNFLHSWYWGEFHLSLGKTIKRHGFFKNGTLAGVMLSVVENARRGRYVTVPGGPLLDWTDTALVTKSIETMKQVARETQSICVRVRPQLISNDFSKSLFSSHGFISSPMHLHAELTSQLDITKPPNELLMHMRKATRYEIKKAEKLGIIIEDSHVVENMKNFYALQVETAKRQKFVPFSYTFLANQFKIFTEKNYATLYTATFEGKILAQAFIIFYGQEAVYHYGASTEEGRKYPGAYLIQWKAIQEAQKRHMSRYNFWGVAPENNNDHRFSGLSLFKRGFGGQDIEYLHAQDLVINKPRYFLSSTLEYIRKTIRRV